MYAPSGVTQFLSDTRRNARGVSLQKDVEALCRFPTRAVGSAGHQAARAYLVERFAELGLAPYAGDSYEVAYGPAQELLVNVVGEVRGEDPALAPLLIGAHYDTVPTTPGADDNAASVAIALAVAGRLTASPTRRSVVIAHFDAEEPPRFHTPMMGSTRFVAEQMAEPVHAAIVLDLVGHSLTVPGFEALVAVMGTESHPRLAEVVGEANGHSLGVVTLPNRMSPDLSDHYAFRIAQHPYLFLTGGEGRHYHAPTDTPDTLDYDKMAKLVDLVEELVRRIAAVPLGRAAEHDTAEQDTANLRRLLGPAAAASLGLRGSGDFERAMAALIGRIRGV